MDLVFNELSVQPMASNKTEAYNRIFLFIETFKRAKGFSFNKIRFEQNFDEIELSQEYTLNDFCNESNNKTLGILLRGLARYPFIDENTEEEKLYIENKFYIKKDNKLVNITGLAAAYLYDTLGIGIQSEDFWNKFEYEIEIHGIENFSKKVWCASKSEHFETEIFKNWLRNNEYKRFLSGECFFNFFPNYNFQEKAVGDIRFWETNKAIYNRLYKLLKDISVNPFVDGLGKTESLKGRTDTYSKRIDDNNRIIYTFQNNIITILSCKGHY